MNVGELREWLEDFSDDAEVMISYRYGDYWNTTVARGITEVGEAQVVYSDYHRMMKVLGDLDDLPENTEIREVVLL